MSPVILEAFVRVLNKRTEEQKKASGDTNHHNSQEEKISSTPPKLDEKQIEKLDNKMSEFSKWMEEENFQETYELTKHITYKPENW